MMRIRVVLPQPEGPRRQVTWPSGKVKETSSTARRAPKVFVRFSTRMSAMVDNRGGGRKARGGSGTGGAVAKVLASGGVEQRQVVRGDRDGDLVLLIAAAVMVAVDHGQRDPVRVEVDDVFTTEVFAQCDRRRKLEMLIRGFGGG